MASVDLEDAHILKCDLSRARLWHAVIRNVSMAESDLSETDFLKAVFSNIKFWHVRLTDAKFITRHSFIGKAPINETGLLSASEAYRSLKQYFMSQGRYDDASWASFKEESLQRRHLFKAKKISCIPWFVMELLCGYGEKPYRVIVSSLAIISGYCLLYAATGALKMPEDIAGRGFRIWDYLYFSIITYTTVGYGDLSPKLMPFSQMLAASEGFTGVFMMGLFVFTLARKYAAR